MRIRIPIVLGLLLLVGCADGSTFTTARYDDAGRLISGPGVGDAGPDTGNYNQGGPGSVQPVGTWNIAVDTSSTSSFVTGYPMQAPIAGQAYATQGLNAVGVNNIMAALQPSGAFTSSVAVHPGMNLVPIEAVDNMGNRRKAHRSLIVADFLPEGQINAGAASLVLTDAIVAPMAAGLQGAVSSLDLSQMIMQRSPLLADGTCTLYPTTAYHGTPTLSIGIGQGGTLTVRVVVPGLYVGFNGNCNAPILGAFNVSGDMTTSIVITTSISAPPQDQCIVGLGHTPPTVELQSFNVSLTSGDNFLIGLIAGAIANSRESETARQLQGEFAAQADTLLTSQLSTLSVFDSMQQVDLFGKPLSIRLCLTGFLSDGTNLVARVGATAQGPGGGTSNAPGAPVFGGDLPAVTPQTMFLDSNLVAQLLFSAFQAGGFHKENVQMIPAALLAVIAPGLQGRFPADAQATVSMDATLPPVVRAYMGGGDAAAAAGDLTLELGNLNLLLKVNGELVFRIGANITLVLALTPEGGGLKPMVLSTSATTYVLEEPIAHANAMVLESAIQEQIGGAASSLLGDAVIALPSFGGAIVPRDVTPVAGGRYLAIALQ